MDAMNVKSTVEYIERGAIDAADSHGATPARGPE